jgi:hypothetical protein
MFVMAKCGVLFEVRTEFLNIIQMSFDFKLVLYCIIYQQSNGTHVRENLDQGIFFYFCLPDCWLVVSMHQEGPATGYLDTGFLGFPLASSKC